MLEGWDYDVINQVPFSKKKGLSDSNLYIVNTQQEWDTFFGLLMTKKKVVCDTETTGFEYYSNDRIIGMSFGWDKDHFYVPVRHIASFTGGEPPPQLDMDVIRPDLQRFFARKDVFTTWHNFKFDAHFYKADNIDILTPIHDTVILWHLYDENAPKALKVISSGWVDDMKKRHKGLFGKAAVVKEKEVSDWRSQEAKARRDHYKHLILARADELKFDIAHQGKTKIALKRWIIENELSGHSYREAKKDDIHYGYVPIPLMTEYAAMDTFLTQAVFDKTMKELLLTEELVKVYTNEIKLSKVLFHTEELGARIDAQYLVRLEQELTNECDAYKLMIYQQLGSNINLKSADQLSTAFEKQGITLTEKTKVGKNVVNKKVLDKLALDHPVVKDILYLRGTEKILNTYVKGIQGNLDIRSCIHMNFNQNVTTGRMCLVAGTKIQMPCDRVQFPNGKNIEDVKKGDLVYCYDEDGMLHLRKVLWSGSRGVKNVIRLNWKGQGNKNTGSITLTPDHRVRLFDGSWVEAKDLNENDRIMSLSVNVKPTGYIHLYGRHSFDIRENIFVANQTGLIGEVIHHKDGNKVNNDPSNLEGMSKQEHSKHHTDILDVEELRERGSRLHTKEAIEAQRRSIRSGPENDSWKSISKSTLLRWAAMFHGKPTEIMKFSGMDYEVLMRKYDLYNIDLKDIRKRYSDKVGYISPKRVKEALLLTQPESYSSLGVGYYRFKELRDFYGLSSNHTVESIEVLNISLPVYDLEVEEYNNFIANELCVHNSCSNPNVQNVPRGDTRIRKAFICPEEYYYIFADYSQIEVRLTAHYSEDPIMLDAYARNQDIHTRTACEMFDLHYDEMVEVLKNEKHENFNMFDSFRSTAKTINFGIIYGVGAPGLSQQIARPERFKDALESEWIGACQDYINQYFSKYRYVKRFISRCRREVKKDAQIVNYFGRIRHLPSINARKIMGEDFNWLSGKAERQAANFVIQSTAADVFKFATVRVAEEVFKDTQSYVVNLVHDEIQSYVHKDELHLLNKKRDVMEDFNFLVPLKVDFAFSTSSWADKQKLKG
jgi:DNA polymerase I-like protein with 3'-5' exonuclease and polymerase domains